MRAGWALIPVVLAAACGDPAAAGSDAMVDTGGGDAMTDAGPGWTTLIERSWTQPAGSESFKCRRILITEDMYITGFHSIAPPGTHHVVVSIPAPTETHVGNYDCTASALSANPMMLYGAGINTTDLDFPPGVAIKLAAGTYIQLYMHIYNATDASITATSGVQVKLAKASEVQHEAEMMLGGKFTFSIPSDGQPHDVVADCGSPEDWHIFGIWPHMHQLGVHDKVSIYRAGVVIKTLLDQPYDMNDQQTYAMDYTMAANDRIGFICTYVNNTGQAVGASDGAAGEMCFTGFYKWPVDGDPLYCVNP